MHKFILSDDCSTCFGHYYVYYSVTVTRCCSYSCFVLLKMGDSDARNM